MTQWHPCRAPGRFISSHLYFPSCWDSGKSQFFTPLSLRCCTFAVIDRCFLPASQGFTCPPSLHYLMPFYFHLMLTFVCLYLDCALIYAVSPSGSSNSLLLAEGITLQNTTVLLCHLFSQAGASLFCSHTLNSSSRLLAQRSSFDVKLSEFEVFHQCCLVLIAKS